MAEPERRDLFAEAIAGKSEFKMADIGSLAKDMLSLNWQSGTWTKDFKSTDGKHHIELQHDIVEPIYEAFDPICNIRYNGIPVLENAIVGNSIWSYGMAPGNLGQAMRFLESKCGDATFELTDEKQDWKSTISKTLARDVQPEVGGMYGDKARRSRLVWSDDGKVDRDGETYHRVTFMYACDAKVLGLSEPVTNPYVINRRVGKSVDHSMLLNDQFYKNLVEATNMQQDGQAANPDSKYVGVVNAYLTKSKNGMVCPDLRSPVSVWEHNLLRPEEGFFKSAHDTFVKESLRFQKQGRSLPKTPDVSAEATEEEKSVV